MLWLLVLLLLILYSRTVDRSSHAFLIVEESEQDRLHSLQLLVIVFLPKS